jgi:hypothetical protein
VTYQDPQDPNPDIDDVDDDDPSQVTLSRSQIRAMERDAKETRTLKRENALLKAGIDTTTPLGTLFAQAYEGELSTEAINTAWQAIAPPGGAEPGATDTAVHEPTAEERAFADERAGMASGAGDDGVPPDRDPRKVAVEEGLAALEGGAGRDEAMAMTFSHLAGAASQGDKRVILE